VVLFIIDRVWNLLTPISCMPKEQQTPFIAVIDVLMPLKFPGPLQTTILSISDISRS
jgi:hypothetical protein